MVHETLKIYECFFEDTMLFRAQEMWLGNHQLIHL